MVLLGSRESLLLVIGGSDVVDDASLPSLVGGGSELLVTVSLVSESGCVCYFLSAMYFFPYPSQNSMQSPMLPDVVFEADGASGSLDDVFGLSVVDVVGSTSSVVVGLGLSRDDVLSIGSSTSVFDSSGAIVGDEGDRVFVDSSSVGEGEAVS